MRIEDLKVMIEADRGHLARHLERGDRVIAHQFVDSIIDNQRQLEDLETSQKLLARLQAEDVPAGGRGYVERY